MAKEFLQHSSEGLGVAFREARAIDITEDVADAGDLLQLFGKKKRLVSAGAFCPCSDDGCGVSGFAYQWSAERTHVVAWDTVHGIDEVAGGLTCVSGGGVSWAAKVAIWTS